MTGEEGAYLFLHNMTLRQYFMDIGRAFTKNAELYEDLIQEAWMRVCEEPRDKTDEYYMRAGFRAMDAYYRKELRGRRWNKPIEPKSKEYDALKHRIYYRQKRYKK